jgi:catechol 2,3-dioxygenase-like lactoylglutathione lyase family enzyme
MAFSTGIRRATITTTRMEESLRFYRDTLGFRVWYDQVVDDPVITRLLGVEPGVSARVCIVRAEEDHEAGMIGLMEFTGRDTRDLPATGSVAPLAGEIILMLKTERMKEIYERLKQAKLGHVGEPEKIEIPNRPITYEMATRDPNGVRVTFVQFGPLE